MTVLAATLTGAGAIALWATLATLTAFTGDVPPLLLNALTFGIGGVVGLAVVAQRPGGLALLRQPLAAWALGLAGLFGYHALYFAALRLAPPAEAGLINYLWPLLIVLFSALLPGEHLKRHHVIGALLGFAGVVSVVLGRSQIEISPAYALGYACAAACAFVWAGYSVLSRRFSAVPTEAVAGFCIGTSLLSAVLHLTFEPSVWPQGVGQWAAVVALGLGPVGAAFFLWDIGMKKGDIRVLGAGSYTAPLLSTLLLVVAGKAEASLTLGVACLLITLGALIASKDLLRRR